MMRKVLDNILMIFSGLQVFLYLLVFMLLAGGYLFLITQNLILSVILSLLVSVVGFFYVVFLPKKLEREQHLFSELHKYATTMTLDRKSTRLNSSHVAISYAVFCLNTKK